jgi:hypothetical protein
MVQLTTVPFKCRFEIASADGTASGAQGEFCAFEFPGCRGCKFALHAIKTIKATEDPMKSETLRAWAGAGFRPKKSFFAPIRVSAVEKFIHRENLALFKKRLAESHTHAEREILLKLLADEEAKEPRPKNSILKPR